MNNSFSIFERRTYIRQKFSLLGELFRCKENVVNNPKYAKLTNKYQQLKLTKEGEILRIYFKNSVDFEESEDDVSYVFTELNLFEDFQTRSDFERKFDIVFSFFAHNILNITQISNKFLKGIMFYDYLVDKCRAYDRRITDDFADFIVSLIKKRIDEPNEALHLHLCFIIANLIKKIALRSPRLRFYITSNSLGSIFDNIKGHENGLKVEGYLMILQGMVRLSTIEVLFHIEIFIGCFLKTAFSDCENSRKSSLEILRALLKSLSIEKANSSDWVQSLKKDVILRNTRGSLKVIEALTLIKIVEILLKEKVVFNQNEKKLILKGISVHFGQSEEVGRALMRLFPIFFFSNEPLIGEGPVKQYLLVAQKLYESTSAKLVYESLIAFLKLNAKEKQGFDETVWKNFFFNSTNPSDWGTFVSECKFLEQMTSQPKFSSYSDSHNLRLSYVKSLSTNLLYFPSTILKVIINLSDDPSDCEDLVGLAIENTFNAGKQKVSPLLKRNYSGKEAERKEREISSKRYLLAFLKGYVFRNNYYNFSTARTLLESLEKEPLVLKQEIIETVSFVLKRIVKKKKHMEFTNSMVKISKLLNPDHRTKLMKICSSSSQFLLSVDSVEILKEYLVYSIPKLKKYAVRIFNILRKENNRTFFYIMSTDFKETLESGDSEKILDLAIYLKEAPDICLPYAKGIGDTLAEMGKERCFCENLETRWLKLLRIYVERFPEESGSLDTVLENALLQAFRRLTFIGRNDIRKEKEVARLLLHFARDINKRKALLIAQPDTVKQIFRLAAVCKSKVVHRIYSEIVCNLGLASHSLELDTSSNNERALEKEPIKSLEGPKSLQSQPLATLEILIGELDEKNPTELFNVDILTHIKILVKEEGEKINIRLVDLLLRRLADFSEKGSKECYSGIVQVLLSLFTYVSSFAYSIRPYVIRCLRMFIDKEKQLLELSELVELLNGKRNLRFMCYESINILISTKIEEVLKRERPKEKNTKNSVILYALIKLFILTECELFNTRTKLMKILKEGGGFFTIDSFEKLEEKLGARKDSISQTVSRKISSSLSNERNPLSLRTPMTPSFTTSTERSSDTGEKTGTNSSLKTNVSVPTKNFNNNNKNSDKVNKKETEKSEEKESSEKKKRKFSIIKRISKLTFGRKTKLVSPKVLPEKEKSTELTKKIEFSNIEVIEALDIKKCDSRELCGYWLFYTCEQILELSSWPFKQDFQKLLRLQPHLSAKIFGFLVASSWSNLKTLLQDTISESLRTILTSHFISDEVFHLVKDVPFFLIKSNISTKLNIEEIAKMLLKKNCKDSSLFYYTHLLKNYGGSDELRLKVLEITKSKSYLEYLEIKQKVVLNGEVLEGLGEHRKALKVLETRCKETKKDATYVSTAVRYLFRLGEWEKIISIVKRLSSYSTTIESLDIDDIFYFCEACLVMREFKRLRQIISLRSDLKPKRMYLCTIAIFENNLEESRKLLSDLKKGVLRFGRAEQELYFKYVQDLSDLFSLKFNESHRNREGAMNSFSTRLFSEKKDSNYLERAMALFDVGAFQFAGNYRLEFRVHFIKSLIRRKEYNRAFSSLLSLLKINSSPAALKRSKSYDSIKSPNKSKSIESSSNKENNENKKNNENSETIDEREELKPGDPFIVNRIYSPKIMVCYGKLLKKLGQWEFAIEAFSDFIARGEASDYGTEREALGQCYYKLAKLCIPTDPERAESLFRKALRHGYTENRLWGKRLRNYMVLLQRGVNKSELDINVALKCVKLSFDKNVYTPNILHSYRLARLVTQYYSLSKDKEKTEKLLKGIPVECFYKAKLVYISLIKKGTAYYGVLHSVIRRMIEWNPFSVVYDLIFLTNCKDRRKAEAGASLLKILEELHPETLRDLKLFCKTIKACATSCLDLWNEKIAEINKLYRHKEFDSMLHKLKKLLFGKVPVNGVVDHEFFLTVEGQIKEAKFHLCSFIKNKEIAHLSKVFMLLYSLQSKIKKKTASLKFINLATAMHSVTIKEFKIPMPGTELSDNITVKRVMPIISVIPSKQKPRKIELLGSDNKVYRFIIKGHEDLRQDQRVMEIFKTAKEFCSKGALGGLRIKTYSVIPLSEEHGLVSWLENHHTLNELIKESRERRKRIQSSEVFILSKFGAGFHEFPLMQRIEMIMDVHEKVGGDDLYELLLEESGSSRDFIVRQNNFTASLAFMGFVGYIVGLGDRHPSNLMIDRNDFTITHIDFGDCFEVAQKREKFPERAPMRLTRMLVNAMGVENLNGLFQDYCVEVVEKMRMNKEFFESMLRIFVEDPVGIWKKNSAKMNDEIYMRVMDKIDGKEFPGKEKVSLKPKEHVKKVISEAVSIMNLGIAYLGWCPFW